MTKALSDLEDRRKEVRNLYEMGMEPKAIAVKLGVSSHAIYRDIKAIRRHLYSVFDLSPCTDPLEKYARKLPSNEYHNRIRRERREYLCLECQERFSLTGSKKQATQHWKEQGHSIGRYDSNWFMVVVFGSQKIEPEPLEVVAN